MKKVIILTLLLSSFSLLSDVILSENNNNNNVGSLMSQSFAENPLVNLIEIPFNDIVSLNEPTIIEKVEEKILYKQIKGTVYHPEINQTDDTPLITADLSVIDTTRINDLRWVALSRDLIKRSFKDLKGKRHIWSGKIKLGDTIWVDYDKKNLWKMSDGNEKRYEKLKSKYEKVKGYWIVHDVMGTKYTKRHKNGNKEYVTIYSAIDFLQHPKSELKDVWDRNLIISKRKIKYITLQ